MSQCSYFFSSDLLLYWSFGRRGYSLLDSSLIAPDPFLSMNGTRRAISGKSPKGNHSVGGRDSFKGRWR
jgi:hypothetical protein